MSWELIRQEPTFGFTVVGLIVVFGPLLAEKLRLPGLLGLLVGGAIIGPNMLNVLPSFDALDSVGSIGVLYLVFLAGLQLDIQSFIRYRRISVGFGLLTAFIPFVLGTLVALALDIDLAPSILIGSFWASFTLITYPTVSSYGLSRNRAVAAVVGASSITDTISLIILALVVGAETGDSNGARLVLAIAVGLGVLAVWCFVVVPAIGRWFFSGLGQERTLRFMFVFLGLTSSAVVADIVDIEPLIGAFFVGVGLNRIVPNKSPLMSVTDFFGNAFFIPTFLVSVGILFDPEVMFVWETIRLAIGFSAALFAGKAIAAWLAGRIFGLSQPEVALMYSISVAQAAATLAATIIGLEAGLYGEDVVNAVMLVVAVSLIATSVGTSRYAPQIPAPHAEHRRVGEAVLLPAHSHDESLRGAVTLAAALTEPAGGVIQPIVVSTSTEGAALAAARERQSRIDQILKEAGQDSESDLRIDRSVASGLARAAIQAGSSLLLLAWPGPEDVRGWLLGANYGEVVAATALPVALAALHEGHQADRRLLLVADDKDVVPGGLATLRLGIDIAAALERRDQRFAVGPLSLEAIADAGVPVAEGVESRAGSQDMLAFALENTDPGDLVILPMRDVSIRSDAVKLFNSGRSVLVVTHNPESQSALSGSTMTLPVGGGIAG